MAITFKTSFNYSLRMSMLTTTFLLVSSIYAQTSISNEANGILVANLIEKLQVDYLEAGNSGDNIIWDFSTVQPVRQYPVEYLSDSDSVFIRELTPEYINKYSFRKDSLMLLSTESPLEKIEYNHPIHQLAYPFIYMDNFDAGYSGAGIYCQVNNVYKEGIINVEADGRGILILEGDTLENVLRIHSTRTGSICMHSNENDSLYSEEDRMKQEIEERYQWFAEGCRYPAFETISTSYYDEMELVSSIQKAFCYIPDMTSPEDEKDKEILQNDSLSDSQANKPKIIHYTISITGSQINISYSITADANITILVCNHMGMLYRHESFSKPAGEEYSKTIDCSGLLPGTYILYLNVNGSVYSEKVKL